MKKLQLNYSKVLKLTNVLIKEIKVENMNDFIKEVEFMEHYIKNKGAMPIGPLIQYNTVKVNEQGQVDMVIKFLRQANHMIPDVEHPYTMEPLIRITNCMYCHYAGPENTLKFAYDKINLTAFEEEIPLKGDSYTVFVDQQEDTVIADVFMERAGNEQTD